MEHLFNRRTITGNGKVRVVHEPTEPTLAAHKTMLSGPLKAIQERLVSPHATGSIAKISLIENVLPHRFNDTFYLIDVKNAFPSVVIESLVDIITASLGPREQDLATEVIDFIHHFGVIEGENGLPLGAPCSPALFNIYCSPIDSSLAEVCAKYGITYTRYLDDLSFSCSANNNALADERVRRQIRTSIEEMPGFKVNHAKSRLHRLDQYPVTITGFAISPKPGRYIQPRPEVLQRMHDAFDRMEAELATPLHDNPWDIIHELHGWNSVIESMRVQGEPMSGALYRAKERYNLLVSLTGIPAIQKQQERQRILARTATGR